MDPSSVYWRCQDSLILPVHVKQINKVEFIWMKHEQTEKTERLKKKHMGFFLKICDRRLPPFSL